MTLGDVCEHGSLRRSCLVCELDAEVERLACARDEANDMIHEMCEKAEHWCGATASSHYRSYLFARIAKLTGRRP